MKEEKEDKERRSQSRKTQLSLEVLVFVAVSALYLAAAVALFREGAIGLERAGMARAVSEISESVSFHSAALSRDRGSSSENFTLFPTVRLNAVSDGTEVRISACGVISGGTEEKAVPVRAREFGGRTENCADFPYSGTVSVSERALAGGKLRVEISGVD